MRLNRRHFIAASGAFAASGMPLPFKASAQVSDSGNASQSFADPYQEPPKDPAAYRHKILASSSREPVASAIVLAADISGSYSFQAYPLELEIYARSLLPGVGLESDGTPCQTLVEEAICRKMGDKAIAVCLVDFGSRPHLEIPWVDLRASDPFLKQKMRLLAEEIRTLPRRESGDTRTSMLLKYSTDVFANCPWPVTERRMLDICSNGTASDFSTLFSERDALAGMGVTINALVFQDSDEDLPSYYSKFLVTQQQIESPDRIWSEPGNIWTVVRSIQAGKDRRLLVADFDKAVQGMKMKISTEIASLEGVGNLMRHGLARNADTMRPFYPTNKIWIG